MSLSIIIIVSRNIILERESQLEPVYKIAKDLGTPYICIRSHSALLRVIIWSVWIHTGEVM